jgi:hypothetical protein
VHACVSARIFGSVSPATRHAKAEPPSHPPCQSFDQRFNQQVELHSGSGGEDAPFSASLLWGEQYREEELIIRQLADITPAIFTFTVPTVEGATDEQSSSQWGGTGSGDGMGRWCRWCGLLPLGMQEQQQSLSPPPPLPYDGQTKQGGTTSHYDRGWDMGDSEDDFLPRPTTRAFTGVSNVDSHLPSSTLSPASASRSSFTSPTPLSPRGRKESLSPRGRKKSYSFAESSSSDTESDNQDAILRRAMEAADGAGLWGSEGGGLWGSEGGGKVSATELSASL